MWKSLPTTEGDFIPYHSQILIKFMDGKIPTCSFLQENLFSWIFWGGKNFWDEKLKTFALLSRFNAISSRAMNRKVSRKGMWVYETSYWSYCERHSDGWHHHQHQKGRKNLLSHAKTSMEFSLCAFSRIVMNNSIFSQIDFTPQVCTRGEREPNRNTFEWTHFTKFNI